MRALEYQPRSEYRSLRAVRSRTVGVITFDPTPYAKASALLGIQRAARDLDHLVSMVRVPAPDRGLLRTAVERLGGVEVEGILVVAPERATIDLLAGLSGVPLVVVAAGPQEPVSAVAIDHYAGAAAATRHLLELGHRTVFHIAGPTDPADPGPRLAGWRDTLLAAGAEVPPSLVGDWSAEVGYSLGRRLAARADVTAISAANDEMALGVLHALFEAGRRVPRDVSVVGFDGTPQGEFFNPPLTTVQHNYVEMGRRGFHLLFGEIEAGRKARIHETIPGELIVRASTAAAV